MTKFKKLKIHVCAFGCGGKTKCKRGCPQQKETEHFVKGISVNGFKDLLTKLYAEMRRCGTGKVEGITTPEQRLAYVGGLTYALYLLSPAMTMFRVKTGTIREIAGLTETSSDVA